MGENRENIKREDEENRCDSTISVLVIITAAVVITAITVLVITALVSTPLETPQEVKQENWEINHEAI